MTLKYFKIILSKNVKLFGKTSVDTLTDHISHNIHILNYKLLEVFPMILFLDFKNQ